MIRSLGERAHLPGRNVEQMAGIGRAVRDASPEAPRAIDEEDLVRRSCAIHGEPGREHRSAEPAADDRDVVTFSRVQRTGILPGLTTAFSVVGSVTRPL